MNKRNMTGHKQVLAEISKTRDTFTKLDDFFLETDAKITNSPDGPREGAGSLPGLDRLVFLIPCVINRVEEDLSKIKEAEDAALITDGLQAINEGIESVLVYYLHDDVESALSLLSNAISNIDKLSGIKPQSGVRFFHDMSRIVPDFHILFNMLDGSRESKRVRPKWPETDDSWSPECWLDYYLEQARFEEPLIAMVDAEGLSEASLEKGMKQMIDESEQMDKRMKKQMNTYNLMRNRDAAFDHEYPEKFLELSEIPDVKDEDDGGYEVSTVDLSYEEEEEEESGPWASSLPELQDWDQHASGPSFDDSELSRQDFEDDPVYRLLKPFVHNVFERQKHDYLSRVKEGENEEDQMRSPLDHYIVILALKPQVQISSCGVITEDVGHEAPRKGVYMFTMEYLDRIADTINKFSLDHIYHLAAEARSIKKQIEEILT